MLDIDPNLNGNADDVCLPYIDIYRAYKPDTRAKGKHLELLMCVMSNKDRLHAIC